MKCQFCDNLATNHFTEIVKATKSKREMHLCEQCAREHDLIPDQPTPHVNVKALLGLFAGPPLPALTCPACGLQYGEFRAEGRLGCPEDYEAFRSALEPLIERIHRSVVHAGKMPQAVRRQAREAELGDLRERLTAAVAAERYEDAARLRDLVRQKEASDEPR